MVRLGVNLDHVATVRQARGGRIPDVLAAGHAAMLGGADHVVVHLREDRRHVQDRDVRLLREALPLPLELEMAATGEMVRIALEVKPRAVCLVPEKREERTTEGGLSLAGGVPPDVAKAVETLQAAGIPVSLFVDPDEASLVAANGVEAAAVELHTGRYADAATDDARVVEHRALAKAADSAKSLGLRVHAGHGLDYRNVARVAVLPEVEELNIGFAIVARAIFTGLTSAVAEMRMRIDLARTIEAPTP
jgi:pyridoxine 5-phosphate synthase